MSWTLILADLAPLFLGLGAISAGSWFIDVVMGEVYRPEPGEEGEKAPTIGWRRGIVRLVGLLGILFGALCFASMVSLLFTPGHPYSDPLTLGLLCWMGIALFLTPISKLPLAALAGFAAGLAAVIAVTALAPIIPEFVFQYISLKWILIGVFLLVGVLVFSLFKWAEEILELICGILGSRPLLLILSFIGIVQALALPAVLLAFGGSGGILWFFIH